ncbi:MULTISPECIES: tyrosine-type recombinase/integrase [Sphingobium]|uniref:tyrosine-type recombinase/integrase n=1 Tax=Sphingobium TaxID=165695 RepID=UPI0015ECA116|nr:MULTISPECIES: integrase arm-type DNA-binding domain-containing protein [Sphingobium]MCW2361601.1 integrase [Sphingobium sp. B10D3B]MCW2401720.1 integrase [Sphingobium sp. B10D7B]MCW2408699.1 integrase [Sphingobium xanthum]
MLTNAAVKAARIQPRAYKMFDERGLFLFVAPSGLKSWRLKYRAGGKEQLLSLGRWPDMSLVEARDGADRARSLIAAGLNPRDCDAAAHSDQFETVARAWFEDRRGRWSAEHARDVILSLERDVFPFLAKNPIGGIEAVQLLELVQSIEARGAIETARRIRQRLDAIFSYAIVRELCTTNPAAALRAELAPPPSVQRHPALVDIEQLKALQVAVDALDAAVRVKLASRFLALTAVRIGALRLARWGEIEELDGPAPLWRIPAAHMKLTRVRKADAANDHLIPLSPPAAELLQSMRNHIGDANDMIFPIGAGAIGDLYNRAGYGGRHVPHGWRASFSTILNEECPTEKDVIDQALAHVPTNKVEAAYNRAEHLARRRDLFCRWANLLLC